MRLQRIFIFLHQEAQIVHTIISMISVLLKWVLWIIMLQNVLLFFTVAQLYIIHDDHTMCEYVLGITKLRHTNDI